MVDTPLDASRVWWFKRSLYVPQVGNFIHDILLQGYGSCYSIHLGMTKMYRDLRQLYQWPKLKMDIVDYVEKCHNYQQVKYEYQSLVGLRQRMPIPIWKGEHIAMGFVMGLSKTL